MPEQAVSKAPPYSNDAERSVLGCMMLDKDSLVAALSLLGEDDFYVESNKWVFSAISSLSNEGFAIDTVTVWDRLNSLGLGERISPTYVVELAEIVPYTSHITEYCRIVSEKSSMRKIIASFSGIIAECYREQLPLAEIIEMAERFIYGLSMNENRGSLVPLTQAITPAIKRLTELYAMDTALTGVPTGFADLDLITGGLQDSDLVLIAARPSMGKTALGLNIAQNASFRAGKSVAFFSLEMSTDQLVLRIISAESEISGTSIRLGTQSDFEWKRILRLNTDIKESNVKLFLDDTSGISVSEVRSKLRKLKASEGLDMVIIDYLQLMTTRIRSENRQQEISAISRELKALAKELQIPVVALSQLSRAPEGRKDRRPVLSDLRESGAIEQDADIVMMLYRENYYERDLASNETEVIIAKHRNGEIGTVKLSFISEFTKFKDLAYSTP
ncbi:MAG: replicative DNA helicase [Eubacteriaceae bacterium]|nr:replicative DNA helicase [Eubacteriaceae bacterium]